MNSSSKMLTQASESLSPCPHGLGFYIIAGGLAGLLFAAEVSALQPLAWGVGVEGAGAALIVRLIGLSVATTATTSLVLIGLGTLFGGMIGMLLPYAGGRIRRGGRLWLLVAWLVVSFLWVFSNDFPSFGVGRGLAVVAIITGIAWIAYSLWLTMLRWLEQRHVGRTVLAIAITTFSFWVLFFAQMTLQ
jgi:hypothetical protein